MTRAAILGGGLAGMLTAAALSDHVDEIVVLEEDRYPQSPAPRKGLPQGNHSHMLMGGGALALEGLLPGTLDRLYLEGAQRRGMPAGMLTLSAAGWHQRHDGQAFVIACGRHLLDHVVRQQVLLNPKVTVRQSAKVAGLLGSAQRVTGVRVTDADLSDGVLDADLVIDATGRRSKATEWLAELGLSLEEDFVDPGMTYATRLYEAPPDADDDFPAVLIQPAAGTGRPGQGGTLFVIEGRQWIVTMCGTRGGEPPTDAAGYQEFAAGLANSVTAELISLATPISEIRPHRGTANRRRYFERLPVPAGFVAVGDAVAAMNPVYAHGMSVAALGAAALGRDVERLGLAPELAATAQASIAAVTDGPWGMASGQDLAFPGVRTNVAPQPPDPQVVAFHQNMGRLLLTEPEVANAMFGMYTLAVPAEQMITPAVQEVLSRDPSRPPLDAAEAIGQFPAVGALLGRHSGAIDDDLVVG
ncbi:FAD-dependent monooxygenase [Nocardia sp. NPDC050175]|uniref:FAD-dependent monooxygenase n=1 Tax=Nocardia sp. NPDC050175 TaxID=3364317 RepID=UPI00378DBB9C